MYWPVIRRDKHGAPHHTKAFLEALRRRVFKTFLGGWRGFCLSFILVFSLSREVSLLTHLGVFF